MRTVEVTPRDDEKVWILGKGVMIYMGHMTEEEVMKFKKMSKSARKAFVNEYVKKYPEASRNTAGYCQDKKNHVSEAECVRCARGKGWTRLAQLGMCQEQNLGGRQ